MRLYLTNITKGKSILVTNTNYMISKLLYYYSLRSSYRVKHVKTTESLMFSSELLVTSALHRPAFHYNFEVMHEIVPDIRPPFFTKEWSITNALLMYYYSST
jgi:hypothetical protein